MPSKTYTKSIELRPDLVRPYNSRANAYTQKGEYQRAIKDYDVAIERNADVAEPYYNRGMTLLTLKDWNKAKSDLITATELEKNIVPENFSNDYKSIADFEQKHNVTLPEDIAALLTPPQA